MQTTDFYYVPASDNYQTESALFKRKKKEKQDFYHFMNTLSLAFNFL